VLARKLAGGFSLLRTIRLALVCVLIGSLFGIAAPASAGIKIKAISFDPAGNDTGSNSHLNKVLVVVKNTGRKAKQLKGWKLIDRGRDHTFRFPRFKLRAGRTVKIHTGRGSDNRFNLYWRNEWYIWNNDGDTATLRTKGGRTASRCSYSSSTSSPKRC
jgi:hypothetical protein